jgi:hypothetical protein
MDFCRTAAGRTTAIRTRADAARGKSEKDLFFQLFT